MAEHSKQTSVIGSLDLKFLGSPEMDTKGISPRRAPPVYKIIILGESNVGKSSLFLRYAEDEFKECIANTIGINNHFKELVIDGSPVHLQMWDTAGQERFRSIVSAFYRESDGFLLVYDVTSDRSFDYMCQLASELQDCLDSQFTIVVGNKVDCIDDAQRGAELERLRKFARTFKFQYFFSSAKTGENVNAMFEELSRNLYHHKPKDEGSRSTNTLSRKRKIGRWFCFK
ncbi:hypothetical protein PAPHI01_1650 [Pancytospora philotis]|nr:hypothetical protein PAPHI01_1650 [Pancytospora philotis]